LVTGVQVIISKEKCVLVIGVDEVGVYCGVSWGNWRERNT